MRFKRIDTKLDVDVITVFVIKYYQVPSPSIFGLTVTSDESEKLYPDIRTSDNIELQNVG